MTQWTRRELVAAGAAAAALSATPAAARAPEVLVRKTRAPLAVGSANGAQFRNGGVRTALEEAFARLVAGEDPLAAAVAGVAINELDPLEESVGYGGLPNADGVVQLDASVMHGPLRRAGAVGALEGVRTPAAVAKAVADLTDHHLLVGEGAQAFARQTGFPVEADLNTEHSRARWREWKSKIDPAHWLDPARRESAAAKAREAMIAEGKLDPLHAWGTINLLVLGAAGELAGVTTTSGLSWKIPGRVGDSPILGAGLFVDGDVGAAGSTGRGEANLRSLACFFVVEELRRGAHPKDAGMAALERVRRATVERRLLGADGNPNFGLQYYVLDRQGRAAGVSLYRDFRGSIATWASCGEGGLEVRECEALLPAAAPA
jgi:N4-(beta-N-acetylglucosaminyl)-L-asparaginase